MTQNSSIFKHFQVHICSLKDLKLFKYSNAIHIFNNLMTMVTLYPCDWASKYQWITPISWVSEYQLITPIGLGIRIPMNNPHWFGYQSTNEQPPLVWVSKYQWITPIGWVSEFQWIAPIGLGIKIPMNNPHWLGIKVPINNPHWFGY